MWSDSPVSASTARTTARVEKLRGSSLVYRPFDTPPQEIPRTASVQSSARLIEPDRRPPRRVSSASCPGFARRDAPSASCPMPVGTCAQALAATMSATLSSPTAVRLTTTLDGMTIRSPESGGRMASKAPWPPNHGEER